MIAFADLHLHIGVRVPHGFRAHGFATRTGPRALGAKSSAIRARRQLVSWFASGRKSSELLAVWGNISPQTNVKRLQGANEVFI